MQDIDPTKIAYLAGLLDGEGHIGILKSRAYGPYKTTRYRLRVAIGMYCSSTIDWCVENFGGSKYERKASLTSNGVMRKVSYDACWQGQKALTLLLQVQPYLITKQKHAQIGIQFQQHCTSQPSADTNGYFVRLSEAELETREHFYLQLKELNARQKKSLLDLAAD